MGAETGGDGEYAVIEEGLRTMKQMITMMSALAATVAFARTAVVFEDDFSGRHEAQWKADSANFRYSESEGVGGGRALVWEAETPSPKWATYQFRFPVEVGRDYSYRVKAKDTKPIVGRVYVRIACVAKGGRRRLFTLQGRPIVNNGWKGVRRNFVEISGCTPPMPADAEAGVVEFAVMSDTTGRMVFDDLTVEAGEKTFIRYVQSGAYRDEAVGGKVKFAAYYGYDPDVCALKDRRAFFDYVGKDGTAKRVPAQELAETYFTGTLDADDFAEGEHPVNAVLADAKGRVLDRRGLAFTRCAALPARRVRFDGHQRLLIDGKPFFPVGCYGCGRDEARSDHYASLGFNATIVGDEAAIARATKRGIKVVASACSDNTNTLKRICSKQIANPGVIAWYTADELPPGFAKRQAAAIRFLHAFDPSRPAFTVLDNPPTARDLLESFDVIGTDPYPICNPRPIDTCSKCPESAREATFGLRPLWQVPQAFDWHWHRRNFRKGMAVHHYPTPDEFRNMTWQAIVMGVKGIFWYDFDWFDKDIPEAERPMATEAFRDTVAALKKHAEVFLSTEAAPTATADNPALRVRAWKLGGAVYVLAVSTSTEPLKSRVKPGFAVKTPQVELGAAPSVVDGCLAYDLPALGFALTRF